MALVTAPLATARLALRPLSLDHLPAIVAWERDAALRDLNDEDPTPAAPAVTEATVRGWLRPDRTDVVALAIHRARDGACIGWCMLAAIDVERRECRLGLTIGDRSCWGLGYGREIVDALVAHAFCALDLARVVGEVLEHNARSAALLERAGFRLAGRRPAAARRSERVLDELVYVRTRET